MTEEVLLLLQLASTLPMVGLIWFVQISHYPLLRQVGDASFVEYQAGHLRRTSFVVAPFMLVEVAAGTLWLVRSLGTDRAGAAGAGFALLAVVWLSTLFLQVPAHGVLEKGRQPRVIDRLVATNWIRTIAWSARGVLLLAVVHGGAAPPPGS